ncbi:M50 family metallopeptidase [Bacillaceae bacterium Marseille-Q3522]|nr:M50 family metallopeptidase [Bacillaceae bacterium Marseille-Q3522]
MNKWIRIFTYIHVHPLLWVMIFLSVITANFIPLCMLMVIILFHELGHAAVAVHFSWRIKKISLLPFGGVAEMDEHGNRPFKEELFVILAGPLQHIWLIGLACLLFINGMIPERYVHQFIDFNIMILAVNLLPIWPLDGGKLLFLFFCKKASFLSAHRLVLILSSVNVVVIAAITVLYAPLHLNIWIVVIFLGFSLYLEWRQQYYVFLRFLLERHYGKKSSIRALKRIDAAEEERIIDVFARFRRGVKHQIVINNSGKETGIIDENELLYAFFSQKTIDVKMVDFLSRY